MSPNSPSESFLRWDPAQVANFVSSALPGSQQHKGTSFLEHNIEGSQLPFITTEHLKEIGIEDLGTRLRLKKAISNLCELHYQNNSPNSLTDSQYQLNNVNINSNYINIESVKLATILMKQMIRKLMTQGSGGEGLPMSPGNQQLEMKRLNDNFTKLKTDLIPVIKYLKESKPLPTPTLDPGSKSNTAESPSVMTPPLTELSNHRNLTEDPVGKQYDAMGSANPGSAKITRSNTIGASQTSPKRHSMAPSTVSNRSSTGTFMSMGSGTVIEQAIAKTVGPDGREGDLNERPTVSSSSSSRTIRPRLVEAKSTTRPGSNSFESSYSGNPAASVNLQPRSQPSTTTFGSGVGGTEPLKQLRASSDDSCLKILQHAMKRHNIHRDDWSKYVLVVCYGDKERILKVSEKPVIIFKELQEKGMHPAIMLRQLASDIGSENETLYENSRIGDDMPGGFL